MGYCCRLYSHQELEDICSQAACSWPHHPAALQPVVSEQQLECLFYVIGRAGCIEAITSQNLLARIFGMAGLLALVHFLDFEYGIYGVLTILIFYFYRDDRNLPLYQGILTLGGILVYRFHEIQLFSVISSFLIPAVRRNDYQLNRLVQYGFYPVHIVLLLIIKTIAGLE